jgi:dolichol kinase
MFLGGALISLLMLLIVFQPSTIGLQETKVGTIVFLISFAATLVESITPSDYDNITVPAVSLLLSISLL